MTRSIEELTRIHEPTPEEIEAAARAIHDINYPSPEYDDAERVRLWGIAKSSYIPFAKAAITAFLEHRTKKGQGDE